QSGIRNVILISIDTCRADHLGCYGFDGPITPRIDEIAGEGILFKKAHTPVPLTLPAHCSMLTGTYPPYHQVHDNLGYKLSDSQVTVAEILQEHGYATGAIISSFVLDGQFGIDQGFDSYQDEFEEPIGFGQFTERRGEEASRFACEFLTEHQSEPFFLFLHYFDPHYEYEPPEPFASRYSDDLYAGEIAYTDQCIGQVIDQLKKLGLYDSTLLIIVGDHGEGLGEHGESTHGYYIYQSTIQVPFIVRAPGKTKPREIEENVCLVDVPPTILGYLGIAIPEHIQGNDLSDYSQDRVATAGTRYIYTETLTPTKFGCNPLLGVVSDQWDYIHTNRQELYDFQEDPLELNNLADKQPQQIRLMNNHLQAMVTGLVGDKLSDSHLLIDVESQKRLESLGYVGEMSVNETLALDAAKKDAKDMIRCQEYREQIARFLDKNEYDKAQAICNQMLSEWPESPIVHLLQMSTSFQAHRPVKVIEHGRQYIALMPEANPLGQAANNAITSNTRTIAYDMMMRSASELERWDIVAEFCLKLLQLQPQDTEVRNKLALSYFHLGKHEQAFDIWAQILQLRPDMAEVYGNMGWAYIQLGDFDRSITSWSKALQLKPDWTLVRESLNAAMQMKQLDQSIAQYMEKLGRNPNDSDLHNKLARAYLRQGTNDKAISHLRIAIRLKPDVPEPYNNLAGLLVTANEQELRNPAEAVRLAERAAELSQYKNAAILDTLSIAYAATDN
ncbi:sulfatase-like hydrolase/transferase, partial [Planctomycetota bacterium]